MRGTQTPTPLMALQQVKSCLDGHVIGGLGIRTRLLGESLVIAAFFQDNDVINS
jgi:hypothetical protein